MANNKLEQKIIKLLELSKKNSNKEEAIAAAAKAQELMAKYNISVANLKGNANKQPEFSYASCVGRIFTATPQMLQLPLKYTNGCGMLFTVWLTVIKQKFGNRVMALKVYMVVLCKGF